MYGLLELQKSVRPIAKRNWVAHAAALVPWCSSRMIYTHIHFQIQDSLFVFKWQWVPRNFPAAIVHPLDEHAVFHRGQTSRRKILD